VGNGASSTENCFCSCITGSSTTTSSEACTADALDWTVDTAGDDLTPKNDLTTAELLAVDFGFAAAEASTVTAAAVKATLVLAAGSTSARLRGGELGVSVRSTTPADTALLLLISVEPGGPFSTT